MSLFAGDDLRTFAAANNEFAVALYHQLRTGEGNLFFSLYNIRSALITAYAGARGRTAAGMAQALRLPESVPALLRASRDFDSELARRAKPGAVEIAAASGLWKQKGLTLLPAYRDLVRDALGGEIFEADFAASPAPAARAINAWVNKKTRGMIKELAGRESFDRLTRLVLAAAIFFEGRWESAFPKLDTRPAPFRLQRSSETVLVPMMSQTGDFRYANIEGFEALEMPYLGHEISMIVLLPGAPDGLKALEKKLSASALADWLKALRTEHMLVKLPKFKLESSFRLDAALAELGMRDAFMWDSADFSGMTPEKPMAVGTALHKAAVEVNEAGTVAAAAFEMILCLGLPPVFQADHPFLFLIRDIPTDAILFMGRVLEPVWPGPRQDAEAPGPGPFERPPAGSRRFLGRLLKALGLQ